MSNIQSMIKFSHARTALKYGLMQLGIKKDDEVLIPEYNCDAVIIPFKELKIKYIFYNVNDDLSPQWTNIEEKLNKKTKAIMMVNYFGNPQNIQKFVDFVKKNNLFLIEDNAHGHGGKYKGIELGKFGDIGISAPRKLINLYSGGILFTKLFSNINISNLKPYPVSKVFLNLKILFDDMPRLKNKIKKILKYRRPQYENPFFEQSEKINDYLIDKLSEKRISKINWETIKNIRQKNYRLWCDFSIKNNLIPVINELDKDCIPWCFPAYVTQHNESISWFKWGWKNNVRVFSWPTLPKEILNVDNHSSFLRWKKLICFSTDNFK